MFYIIMGVSGSGKSTIGRLLSDRTGWTFYDADDFHPLANIQKMSQGIPLTDSDRTSWLEELKTLIETTLTSRQHGILACSALKSDYRQILKGDRQDIIFVYLRGDYDCIQTRIKSRQGHFMNADMLRSQFDTLEEPNTAFVVDVALSPEAIVEQILNYTAKESRE
jgi:gluconokinase